MRSPQAAVDGIVAWMEHCPNCVYELGDIGLGTAFSRILASKRFQFPSLRQRAIRGLALFFKHYDDECSIDPRTARLFFSRLPATLSEGPGRRDALYVLVCTVRPRVGRAFIAAGGFSLLMGFLAADNPQANPAETDLAACGLLSLAQLPALGPQETEVALLAGRGSRLASTSRNTSTARTLPWNSGCRP